MPGGGQRRKKFNWRRPQTFVLALGLGLESIRAPREDRCARFAQRWG